METPMTPEEFTQDVYFALLLNTDFMPQVKGLGKLPRGQREAALKRFAKRIADHMLKSNLKPYRGEPTPVAPSGKWPGSHD